MFANNEVLVPIEGIMITARRLLCALTVCSLTGSGLALAEKKYGPGVTDTEIKLGQTMPYSGPASAYGSIGRAQVATSTRSTLRAASTAARLS
jgi:hypothetical protein